MARIRSIKPGFFMNDKLADVSPLGRILFAALWCLADREGRLEDRPKKIKAESLPYDDCDIDELLNDLQENDFIVRYESSGNHYIQVLNFDKHQCPHMREPASTIPAPVLHDTSPSHAGDPGEQQGNSKGNSKGNSTPSHPPKGEAAEIFDSAPVPGGKTVPITMAKIAEWEKTFPTLNVRDGVKDCIQWLRDNPHKQGSRPIARIGKWLMNNRTRAAPRDDFVPNPPPDDGIDDEAGLELIRSLQVRV